MTDTRNNESTRKALMEFEFSESVDMDFVLAWVEDIEVSPAEKKKMERVRKRCGARFYSNVLFALTHRFYPVEKARALWQAMRKHRTWMSEKLERPVKIHVAALDYLSTITQELEKPILISEQRFARVARVAITDGLTGLYDRASFFSQLDDEIARFQRYGNEFSLIMCDMDHFKDYNDTHGHPAGDQALVAFAEILGSETRSLDVSARYGGEEFIVLLPQTPLDEAEVIAGRMRSRTETTLRTPSPITVSLGVASCPRHGKTARQLVKAADRALYAAKGKGRNRVAVA